MTQPKLYALKIRKTDLALITLLNDGVAPPLTPKTYLVFQVASNGKTVWTKILTERELYVYEISNLSPLLLALKK